MLMRVSSITYHVSGSHKNRTFPSASYRTFVPTVMLSRSEASLPLSNESSFAAAAASLRMTNPEHTCDCLYLGHAAGLRSGSRCLQPGGCRSAHHIKAGQPAPTSNTG